MVEEDDSHKRAIVAASVPSATDQTKKDADTAKQVAMSKNSDQFLACLCLKSVDHDRHGSLTRGLNTQFSLEHDHDPKTPLDARDIIHNHRFDPEHKVKKRTRKGKTDPTRRMMMERTKIQR